MKVEIREGKRQFLANLTLNSSGICLAKTHLVYRPILEVILSYVIFGDPLVRTRTVLQLHRQHFALAECKIAGLSTDGFWASASRGGKDT